MLTSSPEPLTWPAPGRARRPQNGGKCTLGGTERLPGGQRTESPERLARIAATPHRRANTWSPFVGRVVVDVMPKPEILDPQGKAVAGALPRLGFGQFASVRQGKRFELEVAGPVTEEIPAGAREAGEHVPSNPVIGDVVAVYEDGQACPGSASSPPRARSTSGMPPARAASRVPGPSRCGTATRASTASTRWS